MTPTSDDASPGRPVRSGSCRHRECSRHLDVGDVHRRAASVTLSSPRRDPAVTAGHVHARPGASQPPAVRRSGRGARAGAARLGDARRPARTRRIVIAPASGPGATTSTLTLGEPLAPELREVDRGRVVDRAREWGLPIDTWATGRDGSRSSRASQPEASATYATGPMSTLAPWRRRSPVALTSTRAEPVRR